MWILCKSELFVVLFFFFNDTATTKIYTLSLHDALPIYSKKRWLVLFAFSMFGLCQGLQCNTWPPILDTLTVAYDWSDSFVALLPAASNAGFILLGLPMMYLVDTRGEWIFDHRLQIGRAHV